MRANGVSTIHCVGDGFGSPDPAVRCAPNGVRPQLTASPSNPASGNDFNDLAASCYFSPEEQRRRSRYPQTSDLEFARQRYHYCPLWQPAPGPGATVPALPSGVCSTVGARGWNPVGADGGTFVHPYGGAELAGFAQEFTCPKRVLTPDQSFCIAGGSNWTDDEYRRAANPVAAEYCTLFGPAGNWEQRLSRTTDTQGPHPVYVCFARADCDDQRTIARDACHPSPTFDPGTTETGNTYSTPTSASAYVRVSQRSNPAVTLTVPANATASIDLASPQRALVTNLVVTQQAPTSFMGTTITDTMARSSDVWIARWNDALSRYDVDPSTGDIQARSVIGGAPFWNNYRSLSSPPPRITTVGTNLVIDASFEDVANDLAIELHVELAADAAMPTAVIPEASTAGGDRECTGPGGVTVTVSGSATSGVVGVAPSWSWMFHMPNDNMLYEQNTPSVTLHLPLEGAGAPARVLSLVSRRGARVAIADIALRAVDTTGPTIAQTALKLACGWGTSLADPIANAPTARAFVRPALSDLCSGVGGSEILAVRAYDYPSNALLFEQSYSDGRDYFSPVAGRLDGFLSTVDYEIDYRSRDSRGNWSATRRWRGWFYSGAADSDCAAVTQTVTLSDVDL